MTKTNTVQNKEIKEKIENYEYNRNIEPKNSNSNISKNKDANEKALITCSNIYQAYNGDAYNFKISTENTPNMDKNDLDVQLKQSGKSAITSYSGYTGYTDNLINYNNYNKCLNKESASSLFGYKSMNYSSTNQNNVSTKLKETISGKSLIHHLNKNASVYSSICSLKYINEQQLNPTNDAYSNDIINTMNTNSESEVKSQVEMPCNKMRKFLDNNINNRITEISHICFNNNHSRYVNNGNTRTQHNKSNSVSMIEEKKLCESHYMSDYGINSNSIGLKKSTVRMKSKFNINNNNNSNSRETKEYNAYNDNLDIHKNNNSSYSSIVSINNKDNDYNDDENKNSIKYNNIIISNNDSNNISVNTINNNNSNKKIVNVNNIITNTDSKTKIDNTNNNVNKLKQIISCNNSINYNNMNINSLNINKKNRHENNSNTNSILNSYTLKRTMSNYNNEINTNNKSNMNVNPFSFKCNNKPSSTNDYINDNVNSDIDNISKKEREELKLEVKIKLLYNNGNKNITKKRFWFIIDKNSYCYFHSDSNSYSKYVNCTFPINSSIYIKEIRLVNSNLNNNLSINDISRLNKNKKNSGIKEPSNISFSNFKNYNEKRIEQKNSNINNNEDSNNIEDYYFDIERSECNFIEYNYGKHIHVFNIILYFSSMLIIRY